MLTRLNHSAHYHRFPFYLLRLLDCNFGDSCDGRLDSQICYAAIVARDYEYLTVGKCPKR